MLLRMPFHLRTAGDILVTLGHYHIATLFSVWKNVAFHNYFHSIPTLVTFQIEGEGIDEFKEYEAD